MSCENTRQFLLDSGWSKADRMLAEEALRHLAGCAQCRAAEDDYQRLREALRGEGEEAEPEGGWEDLERRLAGAVERPRRAWWMPLGAAVAACLVIGAAAFYAGRSTVAGPTVASPPAPAVEGRNGAATALASAKISPADISREARAFEEVSGVFDRRTSWLVDANGNSDIGMAAEPVAPQQRLLIVRLTMLRDKEAVSSADLVIVPGHTANLTLPLGQGRKLHYEVGTSAGQPARLSIWVEVQTPEGGQTLAALATSLQVEPDQQVKAGQLVTSAGNYELHIGYAQAAMPRSKP